MFLLIAIAYDAQIDSLIGRIEESDVSYYIQRLQNFYTRSYNSDSTLAVAQWLYDEFYNLGADTVFFQTFFYDGYMQRNVIARFYGDSMHLHRVLVGAHHDSRPYSGYAPGADDNASGVSLLLSLASILRYGIFDRTVELVAFAAEEPGLIGSDKYAQKLYSENDTILFYLNADMIGGDADYINDMVIVERDEGNSQSSNDYLSHVYADTLARYIVEYTTLDTQFGPIYSSDYMPFEERGFVTLGLFEYHWNSTYHSSDDVIDSLDVAYATQVIRGASAFVLHFAGLRGVIPDSSTYVVESPSMGREVGVRVFDVAGRFVGSFQSLNDFMKSPRFRGIFIVERLYERGKRVQKILKGG